VVERIKPWLRELAAEGVPTLAVTHRGVIRAVLAEATGWDMRGKPPAKLDWSAVHVFALDAQGRPSVERLNAR
jgi:probable phosphoglycerate mutase